MRKTLTAVAAVLLGVAAVGVGTASLDNPASATKPDGEHKVWVCHATSGEGELKNGYNLIHVDVASTQYEAHMAHATTDPKVNRKYGESPDYYLYDMIDVNPELRCGGTPPPEPVVVEVVPPTMTGPDCDAGGVVNVPEVVGLVYTRSDGADGSVTVTVEAAAGYVLAEGSTTMWTFPAEDLAQWPATDPRCAPSEPVVVEVVPPTVTGPDCDAGGVVDVPEVVGLVYTRSDGADGSVTVTVEAAAGYVLAEGSTTMWTFPAEDLAQWPATDPRCTTKPRPRPVVVEVVPPTVTGPDCDAGGVVNVPEVVGLVYTTSVGADGSVTVTVAAAPGYWLAEGSTTTWTFPADELAQWPATDPRCTTPEQVTPEEPEVEAQGPVPPAVVETPTTAAPAAAPAPEVTAAPSTLPTTGSSTWAIFLIGLGLVMAGAGLVTLSRRYV